MKVPHNILGRTRPSGQPLDPLRVQVDPDAFGAGLARGLENLGQGLQVAARRVGERTEKLDRFQSMSNFSDFDTMVNERLAELKKTADPTGKGFVEQANKMYDIAADEFIAKMVPEDMKMEARYWTSNTRQRIIGDSMNFQYEAGNAYFRAGVDKEFQNSLKSLDPKLGGDPAQLPAQKEKLKAFIDATDLSEIEKAEMYRTTSVGLEGVVYKQAKKVQLQTGGGGMKGLIRSEEGFRATPYWDVNHWRIGYGSDTITRADGTVVEVQPGMSITREDAERDLDYRLTQREGKVAMDQVGAQGWGALSGNARAALASVAYNYGSLPPQVVQAAKTGNPDAIANAVENLSANPARRKREAALIRAGGEGAPEINVDSSPLFANLSYEDMTSLSKDAESEFVAEANAAAEQQKLQINTQINDLLNKINDGLAGQTEIDAARAEGWLSDYDSVKKAQDLYEKRNEDQLAAQRGLDLLTGARTADPTSEEDKKSLNAVIGKGGLAKIDGMDTAYVTNGLVPMVTQTGDIPTDVVGLLSGMIRSNNQQKALFGLDTLAMLQDADGRAFKNRVSDQDEADVNFYRMRRTSMPADQMFEMLNGGSSQQRAQRAQLYEEAQDVLKAKEKGVSTLSQMVQEVTSGFDRWTSSAQQLSTPGMAKAMSFDYETAFSDAYVRYNGDLEMSKKAASDYVNKYWGVTEAGGVVMKYPPEKAGYPQVLGSHDWIDRQARELLQLPENHSYELISDDRTASEFNAGQPASYQVAVKDEFGVPRLKTWSEEVGAKGEEQYLGSNIPARISFEKTPLILAAEDKDFAIKELDAELAEINDELAQSMRSRVPPPLAVTQQRDLLQAERNRLAGELETLVPDRNRKERPVTQGVKSGRSGMKPLGFDIIKSLLPGAE
jgi:GH24 family phage-related lysozyme (muramidase)